MSEPCDCVDRIVKLRRGEEVLNNLADPFSSSSYDEDGGDSSSSECFPWGFVWSLGYLKHHGWDLAELLHIALDHSSLRGHTRWTPDRIEREVLKLYGYWKRKRRGKR